MPCAGSPRVEEEERREPCCWGCAPRPRRLEPRPFPGLFPFAGPVAPLRRSWSSTWWALPGSTGRARLWGSRRRLQTATRPAFLLQRKKSRLWESYVPPSFCSLIVGEGVVVVPSEHVCPAAPHTNATAAGVPVRSEFLGKRH